MRAVRRCNASHVFSWIGSDGWSARDLVAIGNEEEVEGTLSVQPQANPVRGFEEYFLALTVENNRRNPWFVEFWEDHFQCKYPNSSRTPFNKFSRYCTTYEKLEKDLAFEKQLQFVSDAVMAFAIALQDMHGELCRGERVLCDAMIPTKGSELLRYLRNVSFQGLSGDYFKFDPNGDGPARYNIVHFKQLSKGDYQWIKVGQYIDGDLTLDMSSVQFKLRNKTMPESVCSLACEVGQAKKYVEGESCCWHCFNCTQYQIRHPRDETQCLMCPLGTIPDVHRSYCIDIPESFLRVESALAISAMTISTLGILVTLFVAGVFIRHNDTPVVKAAGRELSYVLLAGIFLCYLFTFALVLRPTTIVCGIQRFGIGICFTVVYAALLTKTNRIARIFNAGKRTAKRPSFINPRSQLLISGCFVAVQVIINVIWMIVSPPEAIHHYPTREDNLLVCSSYIDASYMIAFGYPILLIVICTVYAILTRNIPEAFNESKHIVFTMYTTCVIWLAFVPLYFVTSNHMPLRITSMSVAISFSASVTIGCLFSPKVLSSFLGLKCGLERMELFDDWRCEPVDKQKTDAVFNYIELYIILIRPERNVRQSMMPTSRYSGTVKSGTSGSAMATGVAVTDSSKGSDGMELKCEGISFRPKPLLVSKSTQTLAEEVSNNNINNSKAPSIVGNGPIVTDVQL